MKKRLIITIFIFLAFGLCFAGVHYEYDSDGNIKYAYRTNDDNNSGGGSGSNESNGEDDSSSSGDNTDTGESGSGESGSSGGSSGSSGSSSGSGDDSSESEDSEEEEDSETERLAAEINQKKESVKQLKKELDKAYEKYKMSGITQERLEAIAKLENEIAKATHDREERKAVIKREREKQREEEDSKVDGDPVRLTVGSYEQDETDIHIDDVQGFEIKRKYKSDSSIVSGFGYGWVTNLDQRIILGVEVSAQETYDKLISFLDERQKIIADSSKDIIDGYAITSIDKGEEEIRASIDKCREVKNNSLSVVEDLSSYSVGSNALLLLAIVTGTNEANELAEDAEAKAVKFESKLESFRNELKRLNRMQEEYNQKKKEADDFYVNVLVPNLSRHQKNSFALLEGMTSGYDETGGETLNVIDENGYPHLLYETASGSGEWKNGAEKEIAKCSKIAGGYRLFMKDGSFRDFDGNGFIIRITDRNGNFVEIKRDAVEKINWIETSSGEKYSFEYSGKFISKITNVRSPDEVVIYSYSGNTLVGVKDADGDTVTMRYDSNGKMTSLNKCDGSSVRFVYGEQTGDGKILTTATINEEGFAERFEYDRSGKRTDYINHDGNRTCYWYDDSHRTVREIRPDGSDIVNTYDNYGNLKSVNENGNVTAYSYDSAGNKISASYSDGTAEYWTYDSFNLVTSHSDRGGVKEDYIRDERGNIREYRLGGKTVYVQEFDSKGNVIKKTLYGQKTVVTLYTYDSHGNLKSLTSAGIATEYEYDSRNRVTKINRAGKVITEYEYNGHKTVQKNYNGLETVYLTNGRKDLVKITQKDTVTGMIHETRIEYDKRHLPLKFFIGDGEHEKLIESYIYTPEGKLRAEVSYGNEAWIKLYEYKNGQVSEFKQFKVDSSSSVVEEQPAVVELVETTITEQKLRELLAASGDKVFTQKYDYQFQNGGGRILKVTDAPGITRLFEYDCFGNLVKNTDGNGVVSEKVYRGGYLKREQSAYGGWYEYEYADGRMKNAGEQSGMSLRAEYYPDGSIKSVTDRYGEVTYYHYDDRGRVSSIQSSTKKIWCQYDAFDRITKQVIGNSEDESTCVYYETFKYSDNGRKVEVTEGGKYKTVYELDAFGNVLKSVDGNTNERSFVYNYLNQMTESYDSYGNKTLYEYNALGELSKLILPDGAETKYQYNYMGLLEKISDDCGTVYSASYDKAGRLIKERSRADSEKTYEYDNGGRITKVICGGEVLESYTYGNNNRTVTVKDGNGYDYIYNYDAFGRLVNERNRKNLEQNYFYDEEGMLKSENTFEGGTNTVIWLNDRTVKTVRYSDGSENRFTYDMNGSIIKAQNAYGKTVYSYDQGGRLVSQKDETAGEEVYFEYDAAGNRIKLYSSNRETFYTYGKNNEVKEIFDNKQRVSIKLSYDKNGREVLRQFGNGTEEETLYDSVGRVTVKMQKDYRGELLWGEGYVYGTDGKRTATVDNAGRVTFYEYNLKGQLAAVYYPYTQEMEDKLKSEAEINGLPVTAASGENRFFSSSEKADLIKLLNCMKYGLAYNLTAMQIVIKESYEYDANGNRIAKTTPYGKIEYTYDKENCLLASGSKGQNYVYYTYDNMGNLLTEESSEKSVKYAYNAENRMIYCEVIDKSAKEYTHTNYAYDAFGRRILVRDKGEVTLRTLYDGFTFDLIKQDPAFENGLFTDSQSSGIRWGSTGQPTGDRYRYLGDDETKDENRYIYLDENSYKTVSTRYRGERSSITVNSTLAAQTTSDYGTDYFATDLLGSVSAITASTGSQKASYIYDAFGTIVQGNLTNATDIGYLGKQQDSTSQLYNYGYRDYTSQLSRFTTVDPIRDGTNWFQYCNADPVNFKDIIGLAPRNMSENDRNAYKEVVSKYINYDFETNKMGISDDYDCADVATYLYDQGMSRTSRGSQTDRLTHNGKPVDRNNLNDTVSSTDFFPENTNNISFYDSKDFNNPYIEVGSVAVWKPKQGDDWKGHIATIVDVERDKDGNVIRIVTIEGHLKAKTKVDFTNINQRIWNSYKGDFLGFGEIGANSISNFNEEAHFIKNK